MHRVRDLARCDATNLPGGGDGLGHCSRKMSVGSMGNDERGEVVTDTHAGVDWLGTDRAEGCKGEWDGLGVYRWRSGKKGVTGLDDWVVSPAGGPSVMVPFGNTRSVANWRESATLYLLFHPRAA